MKNNSFLQYVAEDLFQKFGADMSRVAVVFPNKRASLFLNESLARTAGRPIWSPSYITISDLFRSHSTLEVADQLKLVCDLHKVFVSITGRAETLDQFYGWGQLLLSDFDDIDKNMADAAKVFGHVSNIHEYDDASYLSDEQKQLLSQFFLNFSTDHDSVLKERFLTLWRNLADIYSAFNQRLTEQGLAYEGALYRQVVETDELSFPYDKYVFVGFNMLHQVEQKLFDRLKQEDKALFYWDFDKAFMNDTSESGHFIRQYLASYPNELDPSDAAIYDHLYERKNITYISAPTENVQARYVSRWLSENDGERISAGRRTAIVMCDENLLQAVVHTLPPEVDKVNVTTGYPLSRSPFVSLISQLITLQAEGYSSRKNRFRHKYVDQLLRHPYVSKFLADGTDSDSELLFKRLPADDNLLITEWLTDILQHLGRKTGDEEGAFFQETLFRTYTLINRLHQLVQDGDLDTDAETLRRLFQQMVNTTSVPFHGEPAEGIQIMGVLETRNLDFDHVLLLSCNEGNMPKGLNDASFIPYSIRKAYSLTTVDNKVAIYAYYFHSLLQRATDITLLYNNSTEDGNRNEMSRFMLQMLVERNDIRGARCEVRGTKCEVREMSEDSGSLCEEKGNLIPCTSHLAPRNMLQEKDAAVMEKLNAITKLSPTDLSQYLRCQLRFYYSKVIGLREEQQQDGSLDNRVFGNIFHRAAQIAYTHLSQSDGFIRESDIDVYLRDPHLLSSAVDQALREELFGDNTIRTEDDYNGMQIINRRVIIEYMRQLLNADRQLTPFRILSLEKWVEQSITVGNRETPLVIGGIIDRLDEVVTPQRHIRVIDYKTGRKPLYGISSLEEIFQTENVTKKHSDYYLQTMLYSCIVRQNADFNPDALPVSPALLFIQNTAGEGYNPTLQINRQSINDIQDISDEFRQQLSTLVEEIFDPSHPFVPTEDESRCAACPYRLLCSCGAMRDASIASEQ